jgi:hypothetical protein
VASIHEDSLMGGLGWLVEYKLPLVIQHIHGKSPFLMGKSL